MSTVNDMMTNEQDCVPPTGHGRVYRMLQGFATDGDEFVVSTTGETLTFSASNNKKPPSPKRPDPAGHYYHPTVATLRDRQDPPLPPPPTSSVHLLESSPGAARRVSYDASSAGPSGAIAGGGSVGSVVAAVGSGVCVATLSAYALKHHQGRSRSKIAGDKAASSEQRVERNAPVETTDPSEANPTTRLATESNQNDATASIPSVVYVTESVLEEDQEPSLCSPLGSEGAKPTYPELAEEELDVAAMTKNPAILVPRGPDNVTSSALTLHAAATAAFPFSSTLVRMDSREGVSDFAERLCEVSTALQETMAAKGIRLDEKTTLKLAVRRLEKQDQQDFEIAKELRRYMFEHGERDVDRRQKDRHHHESVEVQREAKGWVMDLLNARKMCEAQLSNGIMWSGMAVVCLPLAYQSSVYVLDVYEGGLWGFMKGTYESISGLCPVPEKPSSPTYFSALMGSVAYYVPSIPSSDQLACCLGYIALVVVGSATLIVVRFLPKEVKPLLLIVAALFQCARLSASYLMSLVAPLAILLVALSLGWWYVSWTHCNCVASLKKGNGRSPSNAEVAEALSRFDNLSYRIAILNPTLCFAMLCLVAGQWH